MPDTGRSGAPVVHASYASKISESACGRSRKGPVRSQVTSPITIKQRKDEQTERLPGGSNAQHSFKGRTDMRHAHLPNVVFELIRAAGPEGAAELFFVCHPVASGIRHLDGLRCGVR